MDVGAAFVTCPEPSELVQPGQRSLHHPAGFPQATSMFGVAVSQHRVDPAPP
jgi:hypothetical protein